MSHKPYVIVYIDNLTQLEAIHLWEALRRLPAESGLCKIHREYPDDRPGRPAIAIGMFNSDDATNMDVMALLVDAGINSVGLISYDGFHNVAEWNYPEW